MNFSQFTKQNLQQDEIKEEKLKGDIKSSYDQLKDLNTDQLSKKLFDEVSRQKKNGTFDYEMLISSVESIKHLIPKENYENLKRLLNSIK